MAKVTFTFEDIENGDVDCQMLIDPPIKDTATDITPAQSYGLEVIGFLHMMFGISNPKLNSEPVDSIEDLLEVENESETQTTKKKT